MFLIRAHPLGGVGGRSPAVLEWMCTKRCRVEEGLLKMLHSSTRNLCDVFLEKCDRIISHACQGRGRGQGGDLLVAMEKCFLRMGSN